MAPASMSANGFPTTSRFRCGAGADADGAIKRSFRKLASQFHSGCESRWTPALTASFKRASSEAYEMWLFRISGEATQIRAVRPSTGARLGGGSGAAAPPASMSDSGVTATSTDFIQRPARPASVFQRGSCRLLSAPGGFGFLRRAFPGGGIPSGFRWGPRTHIRGQPGCRSHDPTFSFARGFKRL